MILHLMKSVRIVVLDDDTALLTLILIFEGEFKKVLFNELLFLEFGEMLLGII